MKCKMCGDKAIGDRYCLKDWLKFRAWTRGLDIRLKQHEAAYAGDYHGYLDNEYDYYPIKRNLQLDLSG